MRSRCSFFWARGLVLAGILALGIGLSPLSGQTGTGCSTEVILYVDKTESVNSRETARTVLATLAGVPNLSQVTLFGFSGEVPVSTFWAEPAPLDAAGVERLLNQTILREPSSAFTLAPDYLALFDHIEQTVRERPTVASLRVYIVVSDFSMRRGEASHERGLPAAVLERLGGLRRSLVAQGNQRLLAIRTRPRQEPSPSLQNDLLGEIAKNFTLVEEPAQITDVLATVFSGDSPPRLELSFNPQTSIYSLTLANSSCLVRQNITYHTMAAGTRTQLSIPWCPTELQPGDTGTCTFASEQIVLPPLPDTCLNVWLRAESGGLIGTANDPILFGNCVFLSAIELDSTRSLAAGNDPALSECARAAVGQPDRFVACLKVRGRVEGAGARLRIRRGDEPADPWLLDEALPATSFNSEAFHGGERLVPHVFPLSRWAADWLCTPAAHESDRRLEVQIIGPGGGLASGYLGRFFPEGAENPLDLWRNLVTPLLLLLFIAGVAANYLRSASLGALENVLLVLGLGLLALLLASYLGSRPGVWLSSLLGAGSLVVVTALLALLALVYWLLFAKGFFDRQLTASGKVSIALRQSLAERRRRRSRRTAWVVGVALVGTVATIALLWLDPREVDDCRYRLVDLPTNTTVPPVNLPPTTAGP